MLEIRKAVVGSIVVSGMLFSGCEMERDTNFMKCSFNTEPQNTDPGSPVYLLDTTNGLVNYKLVLGENVFVRNQKTGALEWSVGGIKQEMFPNNEIVVFDNTTERTADINFKHRESFISADIATECYSSKPLTPINNY